MKHVYSRCTEAAADRQIWQLQRDIELGLTLSSSVSCNSLTSGWGLGSPRLIQGERPAGRSADHDGATGKRKSEERWRRRKHARLGMQVCAA